MILKEVTDKIFNIETADEFDALCMQVFKHQAENCAVYKEYLQLIEQEPHTIETPQQIPHLPIRFFKSRRIVTEDPNKKSNTEEIVFTSSSTTGMTPSSHHVTDVSVYEKSFTKGFELFYGNPQNYTVLALLPSYLERKGSSLVYMAESLIKQSNSPLSGFYLYNHDDLYNVLERCKQHGKTILIGVSFALLDFVSKYKIDFPELIVMETGGMKGRGKEIERGELHRILKEGFGVSAIHSEYGMAELLSQAYSQGNGTFQTPPWMKIKIRDLYNPLRNIDTPGTPGGVNIIDLANINSCSFIETEDMGRLFKDGSFTIDGRIKDSELRGCNLLLEPAL